ncbi:MAG: ParB/RepB/Spo0J family partition protein [Acidobacteria bacterium]|nr:ParB/RepB/Spo0J family partition protein [Acidobacteriota bacterium]
MTKKVLGRGLGALLPEKEITRETLLEIDLDLITPNPFQPRTRISEEGLDQLAASIQNSGVIQPVVVRPLDGRFQLIAGERRWRAAQRAGLLKIPAIIKQVPEEQVLELALVENLQREELTPIGEAVAYSKLLILLDLTQDQIAARIGKDRSTVANSLRLLGLPEAVQELLEAGKITAGHARALLALEDTADRIRAAEWVVRHQLSVRETERLVKQWGVAKKRPSRRREDPNLKSAEQKLEARFLTKVRIHHWGKRGKIEIDFYTPEDLDRIYTLLME